jgi:predicted acylesterase/phospholipase RssA
VLGAHFVLNWDRYCGSEDEFQQAADEVLRFLKLDGRNRIVRRFPMASMVNIARRTLRMPTIRQFTRAGLLERHYEKHLYGDVSLFQLPDRPRLHILATNLSKGCLSSFCQGGLLLQRRIAGRRDRFERVPMGLATVPMAMAASSAFPDFFPPLELKAAEVGADVGAFSRQSFTDGGIYDNIGLRMFRQREKNDEYLWQLDFDFEHTPIEVDKSIVWETIMHPESASSTGDSGQFTFSIQWDTTLVRVWMLMPEGRNYDYFEIAGYPIDQLDQVEIVRPTTTVELPIGSIATFELINPKHNYRYEVRWRWESGEED